MAKKVKTEDPHSVLRQELSKARKENKRLLRQLERAKSKSAGLQEELKKNDVRKVGLNKGQGQLLSSLSKGINIPSLPSG